MILCGLNYDEKYSTRDNIGFNCILTSLSVFSIPMLQSSILAVQDISDDLVYMFVILQKMTMFFNFLFCSQICVIKSCRSTSTQRDSFDLATKSGTLIMLYSTK